MHRDDDRRKYSRDLDQRSPRLLFSFPPLIYVLKRLMRESATFLALFGAFSAPDALRGRRGLPAIYFARPIGDDLHSAPLRAVHTSVAHRRWQ